MIETDDECIKINSIIRSKPLNFELEVEAIPKGYKHESGITGPALLTHSYRLFQITIELGDPTGLTFRFGELGHIHLNEEQSVELIEDLLEAIKDYKILEILKR